MTIEQVDLWARMADLVANRCSIVNQLLGARYDGAKDNPLQIDYDHGRYVCRLCGEEYATYGVYDIDSTQRAFDRVDALSDALWLLGRKGMAR